MIWSIEFLKEAEKDIKKLDHSAQLQVLKGIRKVSQNPLPKEEGGYGKSLGNKRGANLTNLLKIKYKFHSLSLYSNQLILLFLLIYIIYQRPFFY